ncbi:MAG: hypothetical protein CMD19_07370 [Flavobacteriales bacterium]|nr:hypothetical protein [Flavobacteriales bacterium]|tara:strand:- start:10901 stop:13276 length:2376 start_codon:yes stop_codon:yes gene_type:complete
MEKLKGLATHASILLLFIVISFIYFSPVLKGDRLNAHDIKTWKGMSKEVQDFREATGEEALWTNSMFSGMPAYQISTKYKGNLIQYIHKALSLGIPRPASILFLYLLGFYILLLSLKVDWRLSAVGAIAFAFSSYFFIIIQAGHMTKAHAIAYVPMVVAAVLYTYRGKMLLGGVLTSLTVALEIYANHLQITYYLFLILCLIGFVQFLKDFRDNNLLSFSKRTVILLLAALLASGTSLTRLVTTMEYGQESTRGQSELTANMDNKTSGLDKDYATQWSYGIAETLTLLIPNFHGGASQGELTIESETYQAIKRSPNAKKLIKSLPLYWGSQPLVNGPTYAGSIVIFLFFLGLFFIRSEIRIWIILATIMSIMLAWGKNFMGLTEFFLDYFPGYNKFRAVSMILVIVEFTLPLLGFIALDSFLKSDKSESDRRKPLKLAFYITGGISLLFTLMPGVFFDFVGVQDTILEKNGWPIDALRSDRASLLSSDAWRSFIFIALTFGVLWIFLKDKLKSQYVILIIGLLVLVDMWTVNKRYLNDSHFVRNSKIENPYQQTQANNQILMDQDPNFRVFNQSVSTFNDASTSYFHKSIGGYHGAKLKRYQELIENHISKGNPSVINMLNTKYVINRNGQVQQNPAAMGNAWFVSNVNIVASADEEITALDGLDVSNTAVINAQFSNQIPDSVSNADANISLIEYKPNYLRYSSKSVTDGIVIFSEIYYDKGWNAYIDGDLKPHFRANYVLRGIMIPSGAHTVEFKFEPETYQIGERVSLVSSVILLLLLGFVSFKELRS